MPETRKLRIFVSSPGDVAYERRIAQSVLEKLAEEFAHVVSVEPFFWEHEPLVATATFQANILPPSKTDIVICILWARLGTRLPSAFHRPDGSLYQSGTEFEFEDAVLAHERSGIPDLLVYRKKADPLVSLKDKKKLLEQLNQKEALDDFVNKWFYGKDGTIVAAYHSFDQPDSFEQLLELHVRKLIERRLEGWGISIDQTPAMAKATWTSGSPFRGLDVFEFEHAPVFCGRTKATGEVLTALKKQAQAGQPFLLILGMSGCGKSSLVRAGLLPTLTEPGIIEGIGIWRRAVMRPSNTAGDLFDALAHALVHADALPELTSDNTGVDLLAKMLRDNPTGAFMLVKGALSQAAAILKPVADAKSQPDSRLVLIIDQLEEIFTDQRFTNDARIAFFKAIATLTNSGKVWVIATLRSDFYHRCRDIPDLVTLKSGEGQYDLLPPTPAEMGRMIREPAQRAGLEFDRDVASGQSLDDILQNDATHLAEGLPLLEFALDELYQAAAERAKTAPQNAARVRLLQCADYQNLGGLVGSLAKRAEETFQQLPSASQNAFAKVFRKLVFLGQGEVVATRRIASRDAFRNDPAQEKFVDEFVAARLFVADRTTADESSATVRIAHEVLLTAAQSPSSQWPRLKKWLAADRENLLIHSRVSSMAARWNQSTRPRDLLLPIGKPLDEATQLLNAGFELSDVETQFIHESRQQAKRRQLYKRVSLAALIVLAITASLTAVQAMRSQNQAVLAQQEAETAQQNAESAKIVAESAKVVAETAQQKAETAEESLTREKKHVQRLYALSLINQGVNEIQRGDRAKGFAILGLAYRAAKNEPDLNLSTRKLLSAWEPSIPHSISKDMHASFEQPKKHPSVVVAMGYEKEKAQIMDLDRLDWIQSVTAIDRATKIVISPNAKVAILESELDQSPLIENKKLESYGYKTFAPGEALEPKEPTQSRRIQLFDLESKKPIGSSLKIDAKNLVAFSQDSTKVLINSRDRVLTIDLSSQKTIGPPIQTPATLLSAEFGSKGDRLFTVDEGNNLREWNLRSGEEVGRPYAIGKKGRSLQLSPKSKFALIGRESDASLLIDLEKRTTISKLKDVVGVDFASDDTALIISESGRKTLHIDLESGKSKILNAIRHCYSPDGKRLLLSKSDGFLSEVDSKSLEPTGLVFNHPAEVFSLAYSPDGTRIVTGGIDHTVMLWDAATGRQVESVLRFDGTILNGYFSPDGSKLICNYTHNLRSSSDATINLDVCDVFSRRMTYQSLKNPSGFGTYALSPDAKTILWGDYKTAELWDIISQKRLAGTTETKAETHVPEFLNDRPVVVTFKDSSVDFLDMLTNQKHGSSLNHPANVVSIRFNLDGTKAITATSEEKIHVWDIATGKEMGPATQRKIIKDGNHVGNWSVALNRDASQYLSVDDSTTVGVYDTASGKPSGPKFKHDFSVLYMEFCMNDNFMVTDCDDDKVRLWNLKTGQLVGDPIYCRGPTIFSSDMLTVFVNPSYRRNVGRFVDITTGAQLGDILFNMETHEMKCLSQDGKSFITFLGGYDSYRDTGEDAKSRPVTEEVGRVWQVADPFPDNPKFIAAYVAARSGWEGDANGDLHPITVAQKIAFVKELQTLEPDWQKRRKEIESLENQQWHESEAERWERKQNWFAAVFHLEYLLRRDPDNKDFISRLQAAKKSLANPPKAKPSPPPIDAPAPPPAPAADVAPPAPAS